MVECPNCNRNYGDDFKFCPYCGEEKPKPKICPKCELEPNSQFSFCPECGTELIEITEYVKIISFMAKKLYYDYNYEKALIYFKRAIKINSFDYDPWEYKEKCLEELMKYEEA